MKASLITLFFLHLYLCCGLDKFVCANVSNHDCSSTCQHLVSKFQAEYSQGWAIRHDSLNKHFKDMKCKVFIEVGTARAELAESVLKHSSHSHNHKSKGVIEYHAVDPFLGGYDDKDAMSQELKKTNQSLEWKNAILTKMKPYGCRYKLHYGHSFERASDFENEMADCLFLDGDHTYRGLKQDLHLYAPKVKRGGHIFFDDYSSSYMGVVFAVDELVDINGLQLEKVNKYNNYYIQKPNDGILNTTYIYNDGSNPFASTVPSNFFDV